MTTERLTDEDIAELTAIAEEGENIIPYFASPMLSELRERRAADLTSEDREALRCLAEILSHVTWIEGAEWIQVLASRTALSKLLDGGKL